MMNCGYDMKRLYVRMAVFRPGGLEVLFDLTDSPEAEGDVDVFLSRFVEVHFYVLIGIGSCGIELCIIELCVVVIYVFWRGVIDFELVIGRVMNL